jgi:hypothetical protein
MLLFPNLAGDGVREEKNPTGFLDLPNLTECEVKVEKNHQVLRLLKTPQKRG